MFTNGIALSPVVATALFVLAVVAGYQYRKVWKTEGPAWKAWLFGSIAGLCLSIVAFLPLRP
ncbi:MAG: hypothetical protein AAFZ91_15995 [Pseudomonadota bacterium]